MKRVIFLVTLLTFSFLTFAPTKPSWMQYDPYMEGIYRKHCLINENLRTLLNDERKSRNEVFHLVEPLLDVYLEEYKDNYVIKDSLSYAISCIFVSESSNGKGHSSRSTLWLEHYNPFGLTGKGIRKWSWEEENGKRVPQYVNFRTYTSFEEAIESLMWDYLLRKRYEPLRSKQTVKEFLYGLKQCGYMTASDWPRWAYNEIYLKSIN